MADHAEELQCNNCFSKDHTLKWADKPVWMSSQSEGSRPTETDRVVSTRTRSFLCHYAQLWTSPVSEPSTLSCYTQWLLSRSVMNWELPNSHKTPRLISRDPLATVCQLARACLHASHVVIPYHIKSHWFLLTTLELTKLWKALCGANRTRHTYEVPVVKCYHIGSIYFQAPLTSHTAWMRVMAGVVESQCNAMT